MKNICVITLCFIFYAGKCYSQSLQDNTNSAQEIECHELDIHSVHFASSNFCYVINNINDYNEYFGGKSTIDFTKYSLIGCLATCGGCEKAEVSHNLYLNVDSTYSYELYIIEKGGCENIFPIEIWCAISKPVKDKMIPIKKYGAFKK
jgi:hypothetical protein